MSQVRCPFCRSVQVKAMANQPKKYPRPTDPIALVDWQRGYDCKKCGNDFVITPPEPKKPLGFFGKLIKYSVIFVIALIAFSIFIEAINRSDSEPTNKETTKEETTQITDNAPREEDPLKQEFSKEAEEAAHAYIPLTTEPEQKSIADSQDQNDTLSIKTTVRAKDE